MSVPQASQVPSRRCGAYLLWHLGSEMLQDRETLDVQTPVARSSRSRHRARQLLIPQGAQRIYLGRAQSRYVGRSKSTYEKCNREAPKGNLIELAHTKQKQRGPVARLRDRPTRHVEIAPVARCQVKRGALFAPIEEILDRHRVVVPATLRSTIRSSLRKASIGSPADPRYDHAYVGSAVQVSIRADPSTRARAARAPSYVS